MSLGTLEQSISHLFHPLYLALIPSRGFNYKTLRKIRGPGPNKKREVDRVAPATWLRKLQVRAHDLQRGPKKAKRRTFPSAPLTFVISASSSRLEKKKKNKSKYKKPGGPGRTAGEEEARGPRRGARPSAPREQPPPQRPPHGRGPPAPRHPAGLRRGRRARGGARSHLAARWANPFTRAPKVPRIPPHAARAPKSRLSQVPEPRFLTGPRSPKEQCRVRRAGKRAAWGGGWLQGGGSVWECKGEARSPSSLFSSPSSSSLASTASSVSSSSTSLKHTPSPRPQHSNRTWRLRSPRPVRVRGRQPQQQEAVSREVRPRPCSSSSAPPTRLRSGARACLGAQALAGAREAEFSDREGRAWLRVHTP